MQGNTAVQFLGVVRAKASPLLSLVEACGPAASPSDHTGEGYGGQILHTPAVPSLPPPAGTPYWLNLLRSQWPTGPLTFSLQVSLLCRDQSGKGDDLEGPTKFSTALHTYIHTDTHTHTHKLFKKILFYMGVELIYNIVLVSGVQHGDSLIHIYVSILFQILFPHRL